MTETKSILKSKTVHFNLTTSLLISAVWPVLPRSFREQEYAVPALTAWFTIGNIILRKLTHQSVQLFGGPDEKPVEENQKES